MTNYLKYGLDTVWDNTDEADIPLIRVNDPRNVLDYPIYEGSARNARKFLIPGEYAATTEIGTTGDEMDILLVVHNSVSYVTDTDRIPLSGRINAQ